MAEKDRAWSPYNYTRNNPLRYIDPDGMEWAEKADELYADGLQKAISERLAVANADLNKAIGSVAKIEAQIAKDGKSERLEKKLNTAKTELSTIQTTISDLNSSQRELYEMADATQKFAFREITGDRGETQKINGVITMTVVSKANGVHESAHGYQMLKGQVSGTHSSWNIEVVPYQRQFSFDGSSVKGITSIFGNASSREQITEKWVSGIYGASGSFIYAPGVSSKELREDWTRREKK